MAHLSFQPEQPTPTPTDQLLTIGALAKACGVTVRTLRYYEELALIGPVKRSVGKYRLYNDGSLKRVKAILALQDLNYSLEQILEIMGSYPEAQQFTKAERIQATRASLETQKTLVNEKLVSLQAIKEDLVTRMDTLNEVCHPCLEKTNETHCHDSCSYRDVHLH